MINYIEVTNHKGENLTIDITNPWETGFAVENITGLDPGKASISVSDISTIDGGRFSSARYSKRTIVIYLRFLSYDDVSIEAIRHKCYRYFTVKKQVTLTIKTDERYVKIEGYVQQLESTIFSQKEGAAITVVCPDPFLYNADPDPVTDFSGVDPLFEFPFSNESLNAKLMNFGNISVGTARNIPYTGDHDSGFRFYMHAKGEVRDFRVTNVVTGDFIGIDHDKLVRFIGEGIIKGDDIEISTERGNKYIRLIRKGRTYNIINCLIAKSKWLQLSTGDNYISFDATTGAERIEFKLSNKILYEGI